jgi:hypothetical protein
MLSSPELLVEFISLIWQSANIEVPTKQSTAIVAS